jgi:hypothetical protein
MAITDIFSTSLLISLAICLLLVGSVFMYFNQKISEQNHKITSMFDLVSTMAEEVNSVKYHVQMVASRVGIPMGMQPPQPLQPPVMNGGVVNSFNTNSNLITISEDEEEDDDEEEEEEDDDEDDEDDEGDEDDEDDDGDEDDDDEDDDGEDGEENSEDRDIKINEEDETLDSENFDNLNFEAVADSALNESDMKNLKTININISSNDNENEEEEIEIESEDVSDVNIKNVEVLDYKKLSLNKLRNIVTEKGMVTDASKLKKHELLKLLEVE